MGSYGCHGTLVINFKVKLLPKSIPSETFPLATDSNMAPLPFSQAWRKEMSKKKLINLLLQFIPPTKYCVTHLLVIMKGQTGFRCIWSFNEQQFVSLNVTDNTLKERKGKIIRLCSNGNNCFRLVKLFVCLFVCCCCCFSFSCSLV